MSMEQSACEDLKAFERRVTEVMQCLQPRTKRWRLLLIIIIVCTAIGATCWISDPVTSIVPLTESLCNHPMFPIATIIIIILLLLGILQHIIAPQIIANRLRGVLQDYNLSCDDTGKLILRPRPANN